jgi:hypothetical protein
MASQAVQPWKPLPQSKTPEPETAKGIESLLGQGNNWQPATVAASRASATMRVMVLLLPTSCRSP